MKRNEITVLVLVGALLSSVGCATFVYSKRQETSTARTIRLIPLRDSENPEIIYSYIAIKDETYLESLNREMKEKYAPRKRPKRHIGFFGFLKEHEREAGVKFVFPF